MTNDDVISVIAEVLNLAPTDLSSRSTCEDVPEWDALGHERVCVALGDHFGLAVDQNEMGHLTSVEQLVSYLQHVRRG